MPRRRRASKRIVKPFDATTKYLLELDPAAWLDYVGLPSAGPMAVVDSDVATITAEADKVIRVDAPTPWLVHIELQASHDPSLAARAHYYNASLYRRHVLPIQSVVVLLRREADGPELTGRLRQRMPDDELYLDFRYRVVRVWQQPVASVLAGGLATLPLAPLAAGAETALPEVIRQMGERLRGATTEVAALLWTSTYLLMGLRYPDDMIGELLRGVRAMRESSTYQAILAEGRAEGEAAGRAEGEAAGRAAEARAILLRLGRERFGPPDARTRTALDQIDDLDRLEPLTVRLLKVGSWDDLLARS
ncbi:MAG: hypothetical protein H0V51_16380 [Chloroflexi bacterium]|nr:hypothetical protein [Chloroflexota bacterium]